MVNYNRRGMLTIPVAKRERDIERKENERYMVTEAFCPAGCSIVDDEHQINGYPGLRMKFKRSDAEGEFVISAIEGDLTKSLLSGKLEDGTKDELFCPHCDTPFQTLVLCSCQTDGDMVVIGLTPTLDFNNAVTFCNVTGCHNGTFISSGEVLRRVTSGEWLSKGS